MSLAMRPAERTSFLQDLHIGVISLNRPGLGPLSAPIWYLYEDGLVKFLIGPESRKSPLMQLGDRVSLVAQSESPPYKYVSVEGPVVARRKADPERDSLPMAIRYLGETQGRAYIDSTAASQSDFVEVRVENWLSVDYAKMGE